MTETEKMLAGKIYDSADPELASRRHECDRLLKIFNNAPWGSKEGRQALNELFPDHGECLSIRGPVYVDYGNNTHFGRYVYANFNLTILDTCPVYIGDYTLFGPNCAIYTPLHPMHPESRLPYINDRGDITDKEYGAPVHIGSNCWFGGNVIVLPGVTIGDNCVIGAGSVVTHDIPSDSFACGNPCVVKRKITDADRLENHPELFK